MFSQASLYNNGGQPLNWTTTGATSFNKLFSGATAFNQDVSSWDTSNVTNMSSMFWGASAFNNGDQPLNWNTSSVTNMGNMFWLAGGFNQDNSSWNVDSVTNFYLMFTGSTAFNNGGQPLSWSTPAATDMTAMFSNTAFNQDISTFNTSLITNMTAMFLNTPFNQDISGWDVSSVVSMNVMFSGTTDFNNAGQPLNWNTANVTSITDFTLMFNGVTLSDANYDALLIGWDAQNLKPSESFDGGNSQYCTMAAQTARTHMTDILLLGGDNWTITDGGLFSGTCGVLGLEDNELGSILLYPNPVKDILHIQSNNILERIIMYDINGRVLQDIVVSGNKSQENISLTNLSSGMYFINTYSNKGQITKRIVKQ